MRKRDADATRMDLLTSAKFRFATDGYEHTTVRDIAADVGVNQALVYRYFGSKDALFDEVTAHENPLVGLKDMDLADIPEYVLRFVIDSSNDRGAHPLIALLRSTSHDEARQVLRSKLTEDFTQQFAHRLGGPDAEVRTELLAAWVLGLGVLRSVVQSPGLTDAGLDQLLGPFQEAVNALLAYEGEQSD